MIAELYFKCKHLSLFFSTASGKGGVDALQAVGYDMFAGCGNYYVVVGSLLRGSFWGTS